MNTTPSSNSRTDGLVSSIAVIAFLIGTASGNATAMLVIAILAVSFIYRHNVGRWGLVAMLVAAAIGAAAAIAIALL